MKNWHDWALLLGVPVVVAFLDYLVNSSAPFSTPTLEHAGLAAALVGVTLLKKNLVPDSTEKGEATK